MNTKDILKTKVSYFPNILEVDNCQIITLGEWFERCANPNDSLRALVNEIRHTKDKKVKGKLKKKLPTVCIGAELHNRRADDDKKIKQLTGLLVFDIDKTGNESVNMLELKEKLKYNRNVVYVGFSVSGEGLWGIIAVKYPEKIDKHFKQLSDDFLKYGVVLDKSKGANSTDLRYYSYDENAYISKEYEVYTRLLKPKYINNRKPVKGRFDGDFLKIATQMILKAADGEKHNALLRASRLLGGFVASDKISYNDAESALITAITQRDIESLSGAKRTIERGLQYGMKKPL